MGKKILLPLLIIAITLSTVAIPSRGEAAQTLQEINQQLEKIKNEKLKAEDSKQYITKKMNEIKRTKEQTSQEIQAIQDKLEQVNQRIEEVTAQIESETSKLMQAGQELQDAKDRVAARDKLLKARVRLMYTNGAVTYLDVLLSSTSFSDFLDRYKLLSSIVHQDKNILEANQKDRDLKAAKEIEVQEGLDKLQALYTEQKQQEEDYIARQKDRVVMIASLENDQEYYAEMDEEQEKIMIQLASQEARLIKERNNVKVTYGGGKLSWPLPRDYPITSPFGYRTDPINGKKGAFHNGTDIGAPGGTDVLAAADGLVITAGWNGGGFGYYVIIDHGSGLWTLYGHMRKGSLLVEKGDMVKRGQHIGDVGQTGRATGNHLHFGVYLNQEATDAMKYLK